MSVTTKFTYIVKDDKYGGGKVAYLHWLSASGEVSRAGTIRGFADEDVLHQAAATCVAALNKSDIGHWVDKEVA